jgi:hypothetical protein
MVKLVGDYLNSVGTNFTYLHDLLKDNMNSTFVSDPMSKKPTGSQGARGTPWRVLFLHSLQLMKSCLVKLANFRVVFACYSSARVSEIKMSPLPIGNPA